jgi:hypothetical protein
MSDMPKADLKKGILDILSRQPHAHKFNLLGREFQRGAIEEHLGISFTADDRAFADQAFNELRRDGYLQSTYRDLADPENWVEITDRGRTYVQNGLKDGIDRKLEEIGAHLVELRRGMLDAVERTSPDAARHAAHSARELLDQILKEGAPPECSTRKERFRFLMRKHRGDGQTSSSNLAIVEAHWKVVEAEHNKLLAASHSRGQVRQDEVRASVLAAERILCMVFKVD